MILDIERFFADSFPTAVSTSVELDEGENKQLDSQLLSNYFDTPFVIDEIRVQVLGPTSATFDPARANFGGSVRLKMSLGRYALSRTYVPVACLGPAYTGGTLGNATISVSAYSQEALVQGFSQRTAIGAFRWKLPRPLVVPVGMPLETKISRQVENLGTPFEETVTVEVNVAYVGRVTKNALPRGLTVPIPYVGLFENVFTSPSVVVSNQLDLFNPFHSQLQVQRLIARWQNVYLDSALPSNSSLALDVAGDGSFIEFPNTQIRTFSGFNLTNGFIPGGAIWEGNTRSFGANVMLDRGEGFEVTIDATAGLPDTQAEGSTLDGSNTSLVTMIGWRNEDL